MKMVLFQPLQVDNAACQCSICTMGYIYTGGVCHHKGDANNSDECSNINLNDNDNDNCHLRVLFLKTKYQTLREKQDAAYAKQSDF